MGPRVASISPDLARPRARGAGHRVARVIRSRGRRAAGRVDGDARARRCVGAGGLRAVAGGDHGVRAVDGGLPRRWGRPGRRCAVGVDARARGARRRDGGGCRGCRARTRRRPCARSRRSAECGWTVADLRGRAHWVTPEFEPRRYDTWILAAGMPADQEATGTTTESDRSAWVRPRDLLDRHGAGEGADAAAHGHLPGGGSPGSTPPQPFSLTQPVVARVLPVLVVGPGGEPGAAHRPPLTPPLLPPTGNRVTLD